MSYTNGLDKPTDYFNTVLYTGNGSTNAITGVGFQPDWVWLKERSSTSNHQVGDAVRGATKYIQPNITDAESTDSNRFSSFDSDGFTQGANNGVNESGQTYVAWNWLASNTTASNTDGSITSTVSANTTSGFSIVSYTGNATAGATIGHGLGTAPHWIIMKDRSNTRDWFVFHQSTGATNRLKLNATNTSAGSTFLNDTAPTSSVYAVDGGTAGNASGANYIAYCFAEKKGFSKFGSYTGNGNADGTFVYTGFRPAWVMVKKTNATHNWTILDTKRNPINDAELALEANLSNAEGSGNNMDILSNGFKFRATGEWGNGSGGSYIYMCFAESPFVTSTGIPTTAR